MESGPYPSSLIDISDNIYRRIFEFKAPNLLPWTTVVGSNDRYNWLYTKPPTYLYLNCHVRLCGMSHNFLCRRRISRTDLSRSVSTCGHTIGEDHVLEIPSSFYSELIPKSKTAEVCAPKVVKSTGWSYESISTVYLSIQINPVINISFRTFVRSALCPRSPRPSWNFVKDCLKNDLAEQ
jgi:hypothetical protein